MVGHGAGQGRCRVVRRQRVDRDRRGRRIDREFVDAAIGPEVARRIRRGDGYIIDADREHGQAVVRQGPRTIAIVRSRARLAADHHRHRRPKIAGRARQGWARILGNQRIYGQHGRGRIDRELVRRALRAHVAHRIRRCRRHVIGAVGQRAQAAVGQGPRTVAIVGCRARLPADHHRHGGAGFIHRARELRRVVIRHPGVHRHCRRRSIHGEFIGCGVRAPVARRIGRRRDHVVSTVGDGRQAVVRQGPRAVCVVGRSARLARNDHRDRGGIVVYRARNGRRAIGGRFRSHADGRGGVIQGVGLGRSPAREGIAHQVRDTRAYRYAYGPFGTGA